MRTNPILTTALAAFAVISLTAFSEPAAKSSTATTELFSGRNLDGWSHVLVGDNVKKEDV